ncbi:hypothetical protein PV327_011515, partial [Microctonus hyperodae]
SIIISAPQSDNALEKIRQPIGRIVNFHRNLILVATWSATSTKKDPIPERFVLNYTEYADTFEEFRQNYPSFIINTYGEARSDSTFGDVGKNKFGERSYQTSCFVADDNGYYDEIVEASKSKTSAYSVSVSIKIGFLKRGTNLYLLPYMNGKI